MHKDSARRVVGLILRTGAASPLTDAQLLHEFVQNRADEAFAEIVRRHGSMVFSACRRLLGHEQDAEDAFQATFLVLARKASAVRPMDSLGRWLYGVAFRTARKAKSRRHREIARRANLAQLQTDYAKPPEPTDWLPVLDEELNRLSDRERLPIVLCDLMGRSRKEAAAELGLSEGTLSSRLARGRERLRGLLQRRGVVPAITATGLALESASVPAALVESTFSLATTVTTSVVMSLAAGVIRAMMIHATLKAFAVVAGILVFGGAGMFWGLSLANEAGEQKNDANKFEVGKPKTIQLINSERVDAPAEEAAADKTQMADLQKALVQTLQEQLMGCYARIQVGTGDLSTILEALNNLKEAQLAIAKDKKSRIQIMESYLQHLLALESLRRAELKAGKSTAHEVEQLKAKRLTAEILLEKEKGQQP